MSGLNQQFTKLSTLNRSASSNLALSARVRFRKSDDNTYEIQ